MEEWKEYKIGDICRIKHGFAFKGIHFVDEPQKYVCLTPGNFALKGGFKNDKPKYYNGPIPEDYVLQKDDLVVTMTDLSKNGDTLGYSALIPYDEHYIFLHNQRIGLIEDISTDIDKHFLYWVMRTYDYQRYIVGHCSGSTVKHTSPSGIGSYIFRCPEMKMQKEIASILDNLDDKIAVNKQINDNLEQQAQALFKSWFVDFEPFKNGEFVESELGMIPKGWRVGKLGELCQFKRGKGLLSKNAIPGDVPVVAGGLEPACYHNISNTKAPVITVSGSGANAGFMRMYHQEVWASDCSFIDITCENWLFVYCFLAINSHLLKHAQTGAVQPHVKPADIHDFDLAIPPKEYIQRFQDKISSFITKKGLLEQESRRLAELRDALLPKLMSGELKVNEIEK